MAITVGPVYKHKITPASEMVELEGSARTRICLKKKKKKIPSERDVMVHDLVFYIGMLLRMYWLKFFAHV